MPRVNDIRYIGYGVLDIEKEKRFYLESWKLEEVPSDDDMVYLPLSTMWLTMSRTWTLL